MFRMKDKTYQIIKWTVIILLPAISVLYASLGKAWGFPMIDKITATITAIQVFLGTVLCISSANYDYKNDNEEDCEPIIYEDSKGVGDVKQI